MAKKKQKEDETLSALRMQLGAEQLKLLGTWTRLKRWFTKAEKCIARQRQLNAKISKRIDELEQASAESNIPNPRKGAPTATSGAGE